MKKQRYVLLIGTALLVVVIFGAACSKKADSKKDPTFDKGSIFSEALQLHQAGQHSEAVIKFKQGLDVEPNKDNGLARYYLAEAYLSLRQPDQAMWQYRRANQEVRSVDLKRNALNRYMLLANYFRYLEGVHGTPDEVAKMLADANAAAAILINPRYVPRGVEVHDKETGLTWQRCNIGQRMVDGLRCFDNPRLFYIADALQQGTDGWRLPTKDELLALIDTSRRAFPMIDPVAFPDLARQFGFNWSSTPARHEEVYVVDYLYARDDHEHKAGGHMQFPVRLVRSDR